MRIGLVRHFKVNYPYLKFVTSSQFKKWIKQPHIEEFKKIYISLGEIKWQKCYSSDLPRAIKTAETIYKGEIIKTKLLREVPVSPIIKTNLKIPYALWAFLGRVAWLGLHKSQIEKRTETKKRAMDFIESILDYNESNILIVSHGFMMFYLQKALLKNEFRGKKFVNAKHGTIYIYEK